MSYRYEKDPAVYDVTIHRLGRTTSLPPTQQTSPPRISEITSHLYLSGAKAVTKSSVLSLGITHVINCTKDYPRINLDGVKTTRISLEDKPTSNLAKYFHKVCDRVRKEWSRGGKTLIHCYAGVSRSATLCIAYLMKYYRQSLKSAFLHVRKQRNQINPNNGFWQQLMDFEFKLFGLNTVTLLNTRKGIIPDVYLLPHLDMINTRHDTRASIGPRKCFYPRHHRNTPTLMVTLV